MKLRMALVGNPASGLTTLYNLLTGGAADGQVRRHKGVSVTEFPGLYSLSSYSKEDISTRDKLIKDPPDVIINVADASSIERSLYLTLQLMELNQPMIIALNMMDEMRANQVFIDFQKLSEILSVPIIPISASRNEGIHDLIHAAIQTAQSGQKPEKIDFCSGDVHTAIHSIAHLINHEAKAAGLPLRYSATRVAEGDELVIEELKIPAPELDIINHIVEDMETHMQTDREAAIADMRYAFIEELCAKTVVREGITKEQLRSIRIDRILTHRVFAIPIFLIVMFLVFWLTFGLAGRWLSDLLSFGIDRFTNWADNLLGQANLAPALHSLIIDGVFAGVGSVLSFLPIIAVLFFFLSILEDSGYMPRVAFVMDRLLRPLGLSGRSIVPLLIGFGCSVPAIMATRTLPSKRDRYLTTLLIPFMSCSAKLPIYAMFTAALFQKNEASIMIAIYLTGVLVSITIALLLRHTLFNGKPVPFVMVLPNYRMPAARSVCLRMWENVKGFIKKAFTIIFIATIVIWLLQSFDFGFHMVQDREQSILAALGKLAAPIFAPLGFGDWRAATALITGLTAKEAVVSTLAVLTGAADQVALSTFLQSVFTPLSAFAFLVFCLLYMPCVATLAAVRREMGSLWAALGVALFQIAVAWIVATAVFQLGSLFIS
ncbi:MAG TPA: ferrous iron transport protein B [Clostridiales bacterium]|jgi:ferrous iron transport protein B|nr:ferrous iron transport protein B [Clostridiales bacterium]